MAIVFFDKEQPRQRLYRATGSLVLCLIVANFGRAETAMVPLDLQDHARFIVRLAGTPGPLTISDNKLLFGTSRSLKHDESIDGGYMNCVKISNGEVLWSNFHPKLKNHAQDLPEVGIQSQVMCVDDTASYVSNRGELVCLDLNDMSSAAAKLLDERGDTTEVRFTLDMIEDLGVFKRDALDVMTPVASPLIFNELIYTVTGNGSNYGAERLSRDRVPMPESPSIIAVNRNSGEVEWSSSLPREKIRHGQWTRPLIARWGFTSQVIFPAGDGALYSFDAINGELLWKLLMADDGSESELTMDSGDFFFATPELVENRLYGVLSQDVEGRYSKRKFFCISLPTAENSLPFEEWAFWHADYFGSWTSPAVGAKVVYTLCEESNTLFAVSAIHGKLKWKHEFEDDRTRRFDSLEIANGLLWVARANKIHVFQDSESKSYLGQLFSKDAIQGAPASSGDDMYVATSVGVYEVNIEQISNVLRQKK